MQEKTGTEGNNPFYFYSDNTLPLTVQPWTKWNLSDPLGSYLLVGEQYESVLLSSEKAAVRVESENVYVNAFISFFEVSWEGNEWMKWMNGRNTSRPHNNNKKKCMM